MARKIKVNYRDLETKEYDAGTTLLEISRDFQRKYNYPIIVGKIDNDIMELNEPINRSCNVEFYDRSSSLGNGIYGRTAQFLLIVASKKVLGEDSEIIINYSIDKGFYCEIENVSIDKPDVKKIEDKMKELVKQNLIITKVNVPRFDAIKYFKKKNQEDKVRALKYISNTYVNLYRIDDVYDYFYGDLAPSTTLIDDFKLTYLSGNGFVLSYPDTYNPECTLDYKHHKMLFESFYEYTAWGKKLGITNAADLNEVVSKGHYNELIYIAETAYNDRIANIADDIMNKKGKVNLVLIAGPSSSGKTTTAKKLSIALKSKGVKTYSMSIDDYFVNRDKTPKLPNGEYDLESLKCVDVTLFNKHLSKLLQGEKVELPEYNFLTGKREYNGKVVQLGDKDIIVVEGLHALNEDLTSSIERKFKYKIYISPLTHLNIDNHNRIHTSDTRKLRRIVRDNKSRGYSASQTLAQWKNIREGEEQYVFPHQDSADTIINSSLIYELGILKTYVEPLLFSVEENDPMYSEALRLINFLRNFLPIPSDSIPKDSVLREFIGQSCFDNLN